MNKSKPEINTPAQAGSPATSCSVTDDSGISRILVDDYEVTLEMTKGEYEKLSSMSEEEVANFLQPLFQAQS